MQALWHGGVSWVPLALTLSLLQFGPFGPHCLLNDTDATRVHRSPCLSTLHLVVFTHPSLSYPCTSTCHHSFMPTLYLSYFFGCIPDQGLNFVTILICVFLKGIRVIACYFFVKLLSFPAC